MEDLKELLVPIVEEPDNEMMLMNKGVWHKEDDNIVDMVQSLMIDEACLNHSSKAKNNQKIPQDNDNDIEMEQIDDEEDGSENCVNVQKDEEMEGDFIFAAEDKDNPCLDDYKWWKPNGLASGGDNYTEHNWGSEDDMKVWEWSEYTCTHPL